MKRFSTAAPTEKAGTTSVVERVDLSSKPVIGNARLRITIGPIPGDSIPISKRETIVGREKDCDLRFESDFISRHHCLFSLDDTTLSVRDLASTNGTFLNGSRIDIYDVNLKNGDMLSIGDVIFEVCFDQVADSFSQPSTPRSQPTHRSAEGTAVIPDETTQAQRRRI